MGLAKTLAFILTHPMNRASVLAALARYIRWQIESRAKDEIIFDWIDEAKLAVRRGMTGATGNVYCGLHEFVDMSFILHILQPEDLFVDIGANVGSYSVLAAKVCRAKVVAIEPDPDAANQLRRNVELNEIERKTSVVQAALGSKEGSAAFTVGLDTVNKVAKSSSENTRMVAMTTLDALLGDARPRVIKMDVEGYEREVLRGANKVLSGGDLLAVISETDDIHVAEILNRNGFEKVFYDPSKRSLLEVPSRFQTKNTLFVRSQDREEVQQILSKSISRVFREYTI